MSVGDVIGLSLVALILLTMFTLATVGTMYDRDRAIARRRRRALRRARR